MGGLGNPASPTSPKVTACYRLISTQPCNLGHSLRLRTNPPSPQVSILIRKALVSLPSGDQQPKKEPPTTWGMEAGLEK